MPFCGIRSGQIGGAGSDWGEIDLDVNSSSF